MPVFTAIAAAVTAVTGYAFLGSVAAFGAKMVLYNGISKLIGNRQGSGGSGTSNAGSRVQLPPSTDNKLPVVYGTAYVAPTITDAMISTDNKFMWYVCTLAEVTNTMPGQTPDTYSYGDIYYGGKLVTFGTGADAAKVVSLTTNTSTPQVDTNMAGKIYIYQFTNGSSSGVNTGGQTAIQILSDSSTGGGIPVSARWTSTDTMTNAAFLVIRVEYDTNAGTTGLDQVSVQLTNPLNDPGAVLYDYMYNNVYGCAIPSDQIDTTSLADLTAYSADQITYHPVGYPAVPAATQNRYVINGPLNTGNNCLSNLQQLVDACDSWLQYSELTGRWKVVINQSYTQAGQTLGQLYNVDSSVLIGGIDINPINLNETYNSLEVQYPNTNIKDQTDFQVVDLTDSSKPWYDPYLLSPNEADNRLVIQYQTVNNYIQALYLGVRRLLQSREDLTINFMLDYSGIQIEAGDVIKVTLAEYGWVEKLFRVNQVQEAKLEDGSLGARITAFEYNDTVYVDNVLEDFVPADNTGLTDPNVFSAPGTPTVILNPNLLGNVKSFKVTSSTPVTGLTLYMDFNFGLTNDVATHRLLLSRSKGNGTAFNASESVSIDFSNLPPGTYYFSVTAKNNSAGRTSASSTAFIWDGIGVTVWDGTDGGITDNNISNSTITGSKIVPGTIDGNLIANLTVTGNNIANGTIDASKLSFTPVTPVGGSTFPLIVGPESTGAFSLQNANRTFTYNLSNVQQGAIGYLEGTTVSSSYYYPFLQGTSATANGFAADSLTGIGAPVANTIIGPTPVGAGYQGPMSAGTGGWYSIIDKDLNTGYVPNKDFYYMAYCNFQVSCDSDTTLFYCGGWKNNGNIYLGQEKVGSIDIKANRPYYISYNFVYRGKFPSAAHPITNMSIWVKNIVSGTKVYFLHVDMLIETTSGVDKYIGEGLPFSPFA